MAAILALVLGALTLTGCGSLGQNNRLLLANIGWDENVAVSNLTKVLLEDELGYQHVEISTSEDLDATYEELCDRGVEFPVPAVETDCGRWALFADQDGTRYVLQQRERT